MWDLPRPGLEPMSPALAGGLFFFVLLNFNAHTFIILYLFILFLAVLGLRFCTRAFRQLRQAGATLHRGLRASHYRGLSCCGAQAPDAQAQ